MYRNNRSIFLREETIYDGKANAAASLSKKTLREPSGASVYFLSSLSNKAETSVSSKQSHKALISP